MRRLFCSVSLLVVLGLVMLGCEQANDPITESALAPPGPGGTWTILTPVPAIGAGVEGMSVASIGNKIYAALGFDSGDRNTMRIYDIDSDAWSSGAPAPGASSEGAGTAHGGLFYNIGGRGVAFTANWSYDPITDAWTELAPMPTGRAGLAVAVVGNAIYAIGGRTSTGGPNSGGALTAVERYNIDTDTWTIVAPLLSPRSDLAAATVGGKIYVFGGFDAGAALSAVDVYDPVTDTWTGGLAPMPTARGGMYAVETKGGSVYVIGGWNGVLGNFGSAANEAYKVASDTWTTVTSMPTPRAEAGAVGHGGRIYIVGGAQPGFGASVANNEVYKP